MNIGILLAAGNSSRFVDEVPKQLYKINGKEIIRYSIEAMSCLDEIIIVTNHQCYKQIKNLFKNVDVVKNNIDCRIASIKAGLDHIDSASNVIIHDVARPFITNHIEILLNSSKEFLCSQFYFPLVNGLIKRGKSKLKAVARSKYLELVTPQIIDYRLAVDLFQNHVNPELEFCEVVPILEKLKIRYNLIEGHPRYLRKITTIEDVF